MTNISYKSCNNILQNHALVKDPECNGPMDFNVTEYVKFTDMVSDSRFQLTYKKPTPAELWYSIKERHPRSSEKTVNTLFPVPPTYLCEAGFSSHTSPKQHHNRVNEAAAVRIQLSSIKPDNKETYKNVKQCHFLTNLFFGK